MKTRGSFCSNDDLLFWCRVQMCWDFCAAPPRLIVPRPQTTQRGRRVKHCVATHWNPGDVLYLPKFNSHVRCVRCSTHGEWQIESSGSSSSMPLPWEEAGLRNRRLFPLSPKSRSTPHGSLTSLRWIIRFFCCSLFPFRTHTAFYNITSCHCATLPRAALKCKIFPTQYTPCWNWHTNSSLAFNMSRTVHMMETSDRLLLQRCSKCCRDINMERVLRQIGCG